MASIKHFISLCMVVAIAGCAVSGPKESPLPKDGPTMTEVYREHMNMIQSESVSAVRERLPRREAEDPHPSVMQQAAIEHIDNRFPRLPNPDLVMHVFPHLAQGKYPIPGYVTVFPMYVTVEYAMPGEVPVKRSSRIRTPVTDQPSSTLQ